MEQDNVIYASSLSYVLLSISGQSLLATRARPGIATCAASTLGFCLPSSRSLVDCQRRIYAVPLSQPVKCKITGTIGVSSSSSLLRPRHLPQTSDHFVQLRRSLSFRHQPRSICLQSSQSRYRDSDVRSSRSGPLCKVCYFLCFARRPAYLPHCKRGTPKCHAEQRDEFPI